MRDPEKSLRAQILATEHWSLLASRSTTQNEVLYRIAMFLTLVSAGLLSLALVGNATQFSDAFVVFALAVLSFICLVGLLTQLRVTNVGMEDLMYVLAMNRLRGAYTELDPGVEPALMASRYDDLFGSGQTYYFLLPQRGFSQFLGSSMMFIIAVNSALLGLLTGVIAALSGAPMWLMVTLGGVVATVFLVAAVVLGSRKFNAVWKTYEPRYPSGE